MVTHIFKMQKAAEMSVVHNTVVYIIKAIKKKKKWLYIKENATSERKHHAVTTLPYRGLSLYFEAPLFFSLHLLSNLLNPLRPGPCCCATRSV